MRASLAPALVAALAAAVFAAASCSSADHPCSPDAGDALQVCAPAVDGGSDCPSGTVCGPFNNAYRCVVTCASTGSCANPLTTCSAVGVGTCAKDDAGEPVPSPGCRTEFVCFPNRCVN